jgi:hypothetical protein
MRCIGTVAFTLVFGPLAFGSSAATAKILGPSPTLAAPSLAQPVRCRFIRERVERPFGPPEYRERRVCDEDADVYVNEGGCSVRRERVVRPDGSVVRRTVRRCDDD